jgi:hypothetical protein
VVQVPLSPSSRASATFSEFGPLSKAFSVKNLQMDLKTAFSETEAFLGRQLVVSQRFWTGNLLSQCLRTWQA